MTFLGQLLLATVMMISLASGANASGIGGYFEYAGTDGSYNSGDLDGLDYDEDVYGVGVSYDTNVARDQLFNYRFDFGYEHTDQDIDNIGGSIDLDGFTSSSTFGFGLFRNERVRLWLGPALRVSFGFGSEGGADLFSFAAGGGPALGLNVHTGDLVSIGLAGGYQYMLGLLTVDEGNSDTSFGDKHMGFFRIYVLFRLNGDEY